MPLAASVRSATRRSWSLRSSNSCSAAAISATSFSSSACANASSPGVSIRALGHLSIRPTTPLEPCPHAASKSIDPRMSIVRVR